MPLGETWVVTVPPPAAGCADYLVLRGRYELRDQALLAGHAVGWSALSWHALTPPG